MKPTGHKSGRRFFLELLVFAILGLVLSYFAGKGKDEARRACDAQGGRFATNVWGGFDCVVPGEPAAP